jgi:uridine phosphorylase
VGGFLHHLFGQTISLEFAYVQELWERPVSFPNYPEKYNGHSVLEPQAMIAYRRRLGRLPEIERPEGVVICLQRGLPERMRWRIPIRHVGRMMGDLYLVKRTKGRVGVLTNFGIGAPLVVALAEELIAFGVKRLISMAWGGGLQPDLHPGDIVVCDRAIRDEGTSHHYLPPAKYVSASADLTARLVAALKARGRHCEAGATWTTDAPYRETREEVGQYQAEGVKAVEMETAALFALGQVRGVETAAAVAVGDSLADLHWQAPTQVDGIERALEEVYAAAIEALNQT